MDYDEAMRRFGTDRPDTRFGLELVDLSETLRGCGFKVFQETLDKGGIVKAITPRVRTFSRKDLDDLTEYAGRFGARGMAWVKVKEGNGSRPSPSFSARRRSQTWGRPGSGAGRPDPLWRGQQGHGQPGAERAAPGAWPRLGLIRKGTLIFFGSGTSRCGI